MLLFCVAFGDDLWSVASAIQRSPRLPIFVKCLNQFGGWASNFPHPIRLRLSNAGVWVLTHDESLSTDCVSLAHSWWNHILPYGGVNFVVFVVKENRKSYSRERGIKLRIGWLCLFLLDLLGVWRGAISFLKSSLSSLFLLFLAGQFFSPFFPFISSSTFRQNTLLISKEVYHEKEKNPNSIHQNESEVSIIGCKLNVFPKPADYWFLGVTFYRAPTNVPR